VEAVVAAIADVDDARAVAVSAETTAKATAAEAPATKAAPTETTTATARMAAESAAPAGVPTTTAGMAAKAAAAPRMSTTEAAATEVATAEAAPAEVTASAAKVAAEGQRVGRREHADRSRDGGSSEQGLEGVADHHALQCIAERFIHSDALRHNDLLTSFCDPPHKRK
jgi:hypothetical protein